MPAVNLNRIYMIRARERRPILNGVNVPDAAGAYQRAVQPALRAQLAISENDARIKQDDIHRKYQGIATGIRAFEGTIGGIVSIQSAMERARERDEADRLRHLMNAGKLHLLQNEEAIRNEEYGKTTDKDGQINHTGPYRKALDVCGSFKESEAYQAYEGLSDEGKRRFDDYWALETAGVLNRASEWQAEAQQKYSVRNINDSVKISEVKIRTMYDPADAAAFAATLPETIAVEKFAWRFARGLIDAAGEAKRDETDADREAWKDEERLLRDTFQMERLKHVANLYIASGDTTCLNELKAWGGEEFEGECILPPDDVTALQDDAKRQEVRALAGDAEGKREQKIEQDDVARAADAGAQFNNALKMADEALLERGVGAVGRAENAKAVLDAGIKAATAMASGISDPVRRQAFMTKVRESERKTLVRYADELRAQVVFGGLAQTDHEAARAQAGKMLEGMEESVRGPLMEKMDLAIATQEANDFIDEYVKTQPDPYFGGEVTPEQKAKAGQMLEEFRAMSPGRKKTIIGNQLFGAPGGGTSGGRSGATRQKEFTQADVSFLLSQGMPPVEIMDMMNQAREAIGMKSENYMKCLDLCKARMTFDDAVGNQAREYVASIYGAVNDAFGTTLGNYIQVGNDGIPLVDANGKPILTVDGSKKYKTSWLSSGTKLGAADRLFLEKYNAYDMRDQLTIVGDTLREAFAYGMQYVVSRKNGLVRKGETMNPAALRKEMADLFAEALVTSDAGTALSNEILEYNMDSARLAMAQYGIPQDRVEAAREEAIRSHVWRGAERTEEMEEE